MKVRSTQTVVIRRDRVGVLEGLIEIEIKKVLKDDVNQIYTFQTSDKLVIVGENDEETYKPIFQIETEQQVKTYYKTYAEYDAQREQLSVMFPTELIGSAADDYWLQMGLLYNLMIDPIYGLTVTVNPETGVVTGDWEAV